MRRFPSLKVNCSNRFRRRGLRPRAAARMQSLGSISIGIDKDGRRGLDLIRFLGMVEGMGRVQKSALGVSVAGRVADPEDMVRVPARLRPQQVM
jgi:hypothetical protein